MNIDEIIKNKTELIAIKKIAVKHSDSVSNRPIKENNEGVAKALDIHIDNDKDTQKVIANTYYWLDSHSDVHTDSTFLKSIKENANKIYHLDNHNSDNGFRSKVGNVKSIVEKQVKWTDLNIQKGGTTTILVGVTELIQDYNRQVYDAYKNGEIDQHSVGMIYVDIELAVNDAKYPEEFKAWNEVYPRLGNPEKADELGYFWVIKQAKLKEFSSVLWDGSNSVTQSINNTEPSKDTQKTEAVQDDTSKENRNILLI
jgi:predicted MPP superfamily phosphohydrolase